MGGCGRGREGSPCNEDCGRSWYGGVYFNSVFVHEFG
jgi:hypothetical protein